MRPARWALVALSSIALILGACSDPSGGGGGGSGGGDNSTAGEGLKIAFIYGAGPLDDGGWNTSFLAAADYVQEKLPAATITAIENTAPGDQARATSEDLASQGYDLIVGTTFYQPDQLAVAPDFPDTKFIGWGGWKTAPNIGQFSGATEDGRYLDGIVAASMTDSNVIGYPAGYPIPEVVRGINAFTLGAQTVNPDVQVIPAYVNSWYDPAKERQASQSLVDSGADVLVMETNSPAVASVAERSGVWMMGYGWDQSARSPETWLGSFTFTWGPYILTQAQAILDGSWEPEVYYGGIDDGMVGLSPLGSDVPQDVQDLVDQKMKEISSGELDVFAGPIYNNEGDLRVQEGETIPVEERPECCDYYVQGVQGSVPN